MGRGIDWDKPVEYNWDNTVWVPAVTVATDYRMWGEKYPARLVILRGPSNYDSVVTVTDDSLHKFRNKTEPFYVNLYDGAGTMYVHQSELAARKAASSHRPHKLLKIDIEGGTVEVIEEHKS